MTLPAKPKAVKDPLALVLQVCGLRWIKMRDAKPPLFVEFIGLTVKGPQDFQVTHCRFDGSGNEGLEDVAYWWPVPALPKRAVEGFPPHEFDLGRELTRSLAQAIKQRAQGPIEG